MVAPRGADLPLPGFARQFTARVVEHLQRGSSEGSNLPVYGLRRQFLDLILRHRVVVVDAATGSGKSTLVPLFLAEQCAEMGRSCRVVVTQPRRLAARGLAQRVSEQTGSGVGDVVGYRVGSDKRDHGCIVYVTSGHMLEALVHNPRYLDQFSHIVLDEVHERFVEADFLMALLRLQLSRPETCSVRVVVMSATLQKTLAVFFKPLLLPSPEVADVGLISLPGTTPYVIRDLMWDDLKQEFPNVFTGAKSKDPDFVDHRPSAAKKLSPKLRSDKLTRLCKELAPICARLLCQMQKNGHDNVLVFCPGLDQMREMEKALEDEVYNRSLELSRKPSIYLVHSALEEETYRPALKRGQPGEWRVALSTNIAESSLTVPGVNAVVDFGCHRVNCYNDETRMSFLCTEWCSRASMKQRRGRTGRTNDGIYVRLLPALVFNELQDFDESGVERSPLTRVTLEAAHLAQLLSHPLQIRAGLPVSVCGSDTSKVEGVAAFWDTRRDGWRVHLAGVNNDESGTYAEAEIQSVRIEARHVLGLLPAPPTEDRVQSALMELHDLGALTPEDTPTVLGTAYLKLPVDVTLGRLIVMGWVLDRSAEACMMAAALSLTPSCDVLRTPFNTKCTLEASDLKLMKNTLELRKKKDDGSMSEPMVVFRLCLEWLEKGGGKLGNLPDTEWQKLVHPRIWPQFTEKVVDLFEALLRLIPCSSPESSKLQEWLKRARGRGGRGPMPTGDPQLLPALLAWSLAPAGFVAVGQTAALYGGAGGGFEDFAEVVKKKGGSLANTLWWPKMPELKARELCNSLCREPVKWSDARSTEECFVGFAGSDSSMHTEIEHVFRICGPFNGKETYVNAGRWLNVRPPRNPCTLNWYMPRRDGQGMLEVRVNWKSQAETLLHVPRPGERGAPCRPKKILVASGGEYQSVGGRRNIMLRGATLLPTEDGGRGALLWLLAAGMPREAKLVAMVAPAPAPLAHLSREFELRAVRLWQRTLCLHRSDPITGADLRTVNSFRNAFLGLVERRPHRLAGVWHDQHTDEEWTLECLGAPAASTGSENPPESLRVRSRPGPGAPHERPGEAVLVGRQGEEQWRLLQASGSAAGADLGQAQESAGSCELRWTDGCVWTRQESRGSEAPVLGALGPEVLDGFVVAARDLFNITAAGMSDPPGKDLRERSPSGHPGAKRWPSRLVPLHTQKAAAPLIAHLAPFNLQAIEEKISVFAAALTEEDADGSENEYEDDVDDDNFDVTQESVHDEYMWRLAEEPECSIADSRRLCFVESAIAMPPTAICVECELEGKTFSKSQMRRHPDERTCQDCVNKATKSVYRPATNDTAAPAGVANKMASAPSVIRVSALPQYADVTASAVAVCSVCHIKLVLHENCSASQRQKGPQKRRCNNCVGSSAS